MSWLFSQALVEEYSEDICLDGEPSAPLSGNNTQQAYCAPDKMTKFFRLSRFGMTYKPLTEDLGKELLTLYLADFHAKTSQLRGGGAGLDGERPSMWGEVARIVGEVRPRYAFVENSPMLVTRGLERVLADLTSMGYDSRWGVVSAADVGAPHKRERIWILAHTELHGLVADQVTRSAQETVRQQQAKPINSLDVTGAGGLPAAEPDVADPCDPRLQGSQWVQNDTGKNLSGQALSHGSIAQRRDDGKKRSNWWDVEPDVGRVADGVAARVDRLKALGNGQVPLCAATAWELLR